MLRRQHTVITVAVGASRSHRQPALEQRPSVNTVHITFDMRLAFQTAGRGADVLLMTITAYLDDIERVDRRFAIVLGQNVVPAVTSRTARRLWIALGSRFGVCALQEVRLGLGVALDAATGWS